MGVSEADVTEDVTGNEGIVNVCGRLSFVSCSVSLLSTSSFIEPESVVTLEGL